MSDILLAWDHPLAVPWYPILSLYTLAECEGEVEFVCFGGKQ